YLVGQLPLLPLVIRSHSTHYRRCCLPGGTAAAAPNPVRGSLRGRVGIATRPRRPLSTAQVAFVPHVPPNGQPRVLVMVQSSFAAAALVKRVRQTVSLN